MTWRHLSTSEREVFDKTLNSKRARLVSSGIHIFPVIVWIPILFLIPKAFIAGDYLPALFTLGMIIFLSGLCLSKFFKAKRKIQAADTDEVYICSTTVKSKDYCIRRRNKGYTKFYYIYVEVECGGFDCTLEKQVSVTKNEYDSLVMGCTVNVIRYGDDFDDLDYFPDVDSYIGADIV